MTTTGKLIVAVTTRALYDLTESHRIYETEGLEAYSAFQRAHRNEKLQPGVAFHLVRKLLGWNEHLPPERHIEVLLLSRNDVETAVRVLESLRADNLFIHMGSFTGGAPISGYLSAHDVSLFLSAEENDVLMSVKAGTAAGLVYGSPKEWLGEDNEVRIAFDGDAVVFGSESEMVYQTGGLEAFHNHEVSNRHVPLSKGPFGDFFLRIAELQRLLPRELLRTAIVTARTVPMIERVVLTLESWNVRVDELHCRGDFSKNPILEEFNPDIFFDDSLRHLDTAKNVSPTVRVLRS